MMRSKTRATVQVIGLLLAACSAATAAEKPAAIRKEMTKTEEAYFALYNKLNTDRQYDIVCRKEAETGSTFLKRVCKPRYLENAQQAAAAERMQSAIQASVTAAAANTRGPDVGVTSAASGSSSTSDQDAGFRKNMLAVLEKSPELKALGDKRDELQRRLDAAQK
jgi:hypothetical protein